MPVPYQVQGPQVQGTRYNYAAGMLTTHVRPAQPAGIHGSQGGAGSGRLPRDLALMLPVALALVSWLTMATLVGTS